MICSNGRSEAARNASETRKRHRYKQKREEAIQFARREYLYSKLTDEQRDAIDKQLDSSTYGFDEKLDEFVSDIEFDVMDDIRTLLRDDVHPALILRALDVGNCQTQISTGRGGFTIDKKKLLEEVLSEEKFRSLDVDLDEDVVDGITHEDFDVPPAIAEEGGTTI